MNSKTDSKAQRKSSKEDKEAKVLEKKALPNKRKVTGQAVNTTRSKESIFSAKKQEKPEK